MTSISYSVSATKTLPLESFMSCVLLPGSLALQTMYLCVVAMPSSNPILSLNFFTNFLLFLFLLSITVVCLVCPGFHCATLVSLYD
jgi:hypothetical protein